MESITLQMDSLLRLVFIADITLGIITTVAVISHEIPQELRDFGILIYGGITNIKALFYNARVRIVASLCWDIIYS